MDTLALYDDPTDEESAPEENAFGSCGNPLPLASVGKIANPFALFFTGKWRFDKARGLWTPAMNLIPLEVGCNSIVQHERRGNFQTDASMITDCAKRAPRVRVYLSGDERLGEFANFQRVYHVQSKVRCWHALCDDRGNHFHQEGGVFAHHVLRCVEYRRDENGEVVKTINQGWLDGLFAHVVKTGIVAPPSIADRDRPLRRLDEEIIGLTLRLERRGAPVDELEIRRAELVKLRAAMIAAFAEQFPNAGLIPPRDSEKQRQADVMLDFEAKQHAASHPVA